tara:strand:- start:7248 stop:8246 length:999 start_codon:yes stop_codon:yes gene_type:complete
MKTTKLTTTRTFGVEIEFFGSRPEEIARQLQEKTGIRVEAEGWNHITREYWKVVPDGSAEWELVSPIMQYKEGMKETKKMIKTLAQIERNSNGDLLYVNKKCGIHVHICADDATGKKVSNLVKYFGVNEHIIDSVVSPSRRGSRNEYCKSVFEALQPRHTGLYSDNGESVLPQTKKLLFAKLNKIAKKGERRNTDVYGTISEMSDCLQNGILRYCKLNLTSFRKYRTVEFRGFNGSLCCEKISNWINFCGATVDKTFGAKVIQNKVQDDWRLAFANVFGKGCGRKTLKFFGDRAEKFETLHEGLSNNRTYVDFDSVGNSENMFNFATRSGTI